MTDDDKSGPPIGAELAARAQRRHINIQRWMEGQGAKIKAARTQAVYGACFFMAMQYCGRGDWRHLEDYEIEKCQQRALSQARVRMFGPKLPASNEEWDGQLEQVRQAWAAPREQAA